MRNASAVSFLSASGPAASFRLPNSRHVIDVCRETAGADGGAAGAAGSGGAQGAGGGGVSQGGSGGTGGAEPVALSDDTMIRVDGMAEPVRYGDYKAQFVPKKDHDTYAQRYQQHFLSAITQAAQAAQGIRGKQKPPQQTGQPQGLNLEELADMPIIDGRTLAKLYQQGVGPMGNVIGQLQQVIKGLASKVTHLEKGVGTVATRNFEADNQSKIASVISSLGEGHDPADPFLQELAQDIFHSYEHDAEFEREFPKIMKARLDGFEKFLRARDQAKLKAAKERRFVRPGGDGTPSAPAKHKPLTNTQAAQMLFRPSSVA